MKEENLFKAEYINGELFLDGEKVKGLQEIKLEVSDSVIAELSVKLLVRIKDSDTNEWQK